MIQRFKETAERVRRRLAIESWGRSLATTAPWLFGGLIVMAIVARVAGYRLPDLSFVIGIAAVWVIGLSVWAWFRRPGPVAALAEWDRRAGRPQSFVSAYSFQTHEAPDAGERLHLSRTLPCLDAALATLPSEVPCRIAPRAWMPPTVALVVLATGLFVAPPDQGDVPMDTEAMRQIAELGETIEERANRLKTDDLDKEDAEAAKKLKEKLAEAAKKLKEQTDQTPRSVLEQLEGIAREAEKLAQSMGASDESALSSGLIDELERHADTADLGSALRADDTKRTADEADRLAEKIDAKDRTIEQSERIERAFKEAMKAADDRDRQTLAGKQLDAADRNLKGDQPEAAAEDVRKLAREMKRRDTRAKAGERLERLAADLRAKGQQMLGRQGKGGLRKLAAGQPGPQNLRRIDGREVALAGPRGTQGAGQPQVQPNQNGQPAGGQQPVPGGQQPQGNQQGNAGAGQPGGQQPPVPGQVWGQGQKPGQGQGQGQGKGQGQGQGQGAGAGAGLTPVPGSGAGGAVSVPGAGAGVGGLEAGTGTAALNPNTTKPLAATHTGSVSAAPVNPGASIFRTVEGGPHREATIRKARDLAIATIRAQEEALDAEPLPLARREQVLRYYRLLRNQLESEPGDTDE